MGTPLSRRRVLVALATGVGAVGGAGLLSACTGSPGPVIPTATPSTAPDPLLAVLTEREALVAQYDLAGRQQPDLAPRLLPLRDQTEEQVVALRLALALPEPSSEATSRARTSSAVPVEPPVTLEGLRSSVRATATSAAAVCETTTVERAPFVGSLAAAASCHDLLLR
ncbi:MAG: hypothetical protein H0V10_14205 [Geodermatophilaceae bacterium]|nr:hypothetical protein [Geodermatophilaceae bacterium]